MSQDQETFARDQKQPLLNIATEQNCHAGTFIVTGANTGLGYEAAKHLVQLSPANVILAVRSLQRGEEALARIEQETGISGNAEVWELDMGSAASIERFAEKVRGLERLDAVVENAGIALDKWSTVPPPSTTTTTAAAEGMETTIMVNVVGTMLLAGLVLPKLRESSERFGTRPHLSLVGSGVAFSTPGELEKIQGDLLDALSVEGPEAMKNRYPVSKQLLFYAFQEFASINPVAKTGVVINYVNPGMCKTELSRHVDQKVRDGISKLKEALGRTAEEGSRTLLHGGLGGEETHGKFLSECEVKQHYIPEWVTNESGQKMQKRVWESVTAHVNKISPGCL